MAAQHPGPCCYSGVQHEGTALHQDSIIDGMPAYISPAYGHHIQPDCGIIYLSEREDTIQTHSESTANARRNINATLDYLRSKSCSKIGAVGYCAGAPKVLQLLAGNEVVAGFIAHPAGSPEQLVRGITKPLSIAAADDDASFTEERRHTTEQILKISGSPYQINLYSNVRHGFAVRRAVETKEEVYAKKQAFVQAVCWFEEHLGV